MGEITIEKILEAKRHIEQIKIEELIEWFFESKGFSTENGDLLIISNGMADRCLELTKHPSIKVSPLLKNDDIIYLVRNIKPFNPNAEEVYKRRNDNEEKKITWYSDKIQTRIHQIHIFNGKNGSL